MQLAAMQTTTLKAGTCPHGLPLGACPICNGMGGGGGPTRAHEKPKAGEMSWEQCYAIGQMLKAQKLAHHQANVQAEQALQAAQMQKFAQDAAAMKNAFVNAVPAPVLNALSGIKNALLSPVSSLGTKFEGAMQNLGAKIADFAQNIKEKFVNITDKLTALFGETKAAIEKKISEKFKDLKKKAFKLFGIAIVDNEEDEEVKKIEEKESMKKLINGFRPESVSESQKLTKANKLLKQIQQESGTEAENE